MKQAYSIIAGLALATTALFSCNKGDDDTTQNPATEASIVGTWQTTSMVSNVPLTLEDGTVFTDFYAQLPVCRQDDLAIYKADGGYEKNEGATKCDANDPQTQAFTWTKNGNALTITYGVNGTISQLDATTLKFSAPTYYRFTRDQGNTYDSTACVMTFIQKRK